MSFEFDAIGKALEEDKLDHLRWEAVSACQAVWFELEMESEEMANHNRVLEKLLGLDIEDDA